jgi:hypothetical protein
MTLERRVYILAPGTRQDEPMVPAMRCKPQQGAVGDGSKERET